MVTITTVVIVTIAIACKHSYTHSLVPKFILVAVEENFLQGHILLEMKLKPAMGIQTQYSGTPLNGHPSTADTHNITDNSESPDHFSIDFNTLQPPQ